MIAAILGYLLGSIPFGILIAWVFGLGNLREIGSGNIGATNVLRTGNKTAAVLTLVLDAAKGMAAVILARAIFGETAALVAGFAAFVGHCFPVWLRFRGGKGVATFLGVLLAALPIAGLAACATWALTAVITRISSLSALAAAAASPLWLYAFGGLGAAIMGAAMACLIFIRHATNIRRLIEGTEPRIGEGK